MTFLLGTIVALTLNFPSLKAQQERIVAHAPPAILMASILFAAGAFTGIMKGTGMLDAMAAARCSRPCPRTAFVCCQHSRLGGHPPQPVL